MGERCISKESLSTTGFRYTLSLINGKYKMTILYTLMEFGVVRFNEMKKYIGSISYKTLSSNLKELEADQLVHAAEEAAQYFLDVCLAAHVSSGCKSRIRPVVGRI